MAAQSESTALQLTQLQKLHEEFHSRGLEIIAFPCQTFEGAPIESAANDAASEAAAAAATKAITDQILASVQEWNVQFTIMDKVVVNGPGLLPLFAYLKHKQQSPATGTYIKGQFVKFLVSRSGEPVGRLESAEEPFALREQIMRELGISSSAPIASSGSRGSQGQTEPPRLRDVTNINMAAADLSSSPAALPPHHAAAMPMPSRPPPPYVAHPGPKAELVRTPQRYPAQVIPNAHELYFENDDMEYDDDDGWHPDDVARQPVWPRDSGAAAHPAASAARGAGGMFSASKASMLDRKGNGASARSNDSYTSSASSTSGTSTKSLLGDGPRPVLAPQPMLPPPPSVQYEHQLQQMQQMQLQMQYAQQLQAVPPPAAQPLQMQHQQLQAYQQQQALHHQQQLLLQQQQQQQQVFLPKQPQQPWLQQQQHQHQQHQHQAAQHQAQQSLFRPQQQSSLRRNRPSLLRQGNTLRVTFI